MARIRTIKPEFWSHPLMGRLQDSAKCVALALLNFADDEGFFLAEPNLVRSTCRPFDDDSSITRRCLEQLAEAGWIEVRNHPSHGPIGHIVNFSEHQKIDRPKPSSLSNYFACDESTINRRTLDGGMEGNGREGKGITLPAVATTTGVDAGEAAPVKAKKPAKPRGRDFSLPELEMSPEQEAAFERAWKGWPAKGWNFGTRTTAPRRINRTLAAQRFLEILKFFHYAKADGSRLSADELANAALSYVTQKTREAERTGGPGTPPCVPCIANFFSSVEGEKHHWKDALMAEAGAVEVAS